MDESENGEHTYTDDMDVDTTAQSALSSTEDREDGDSAEVSSAVEDEEEPPVEEEGDIEHEDATRSRHFATPSALEQTMSEAKLRDTLRDLCERIVKGFGDVLEGTEKKSSNSAWDVYHGPELGTAGVARLFHDIHVRDPDFIISGSRPLDLAKRFIDHAISACEAHLDGLLRRKTALHNCGYVMSPAGVWSTAAVVYNALEEKNRTDEYIDRMVSMHQPAFSSHAPVELYYGRPGYLHALLYISSHLPNDPRIPTALIHDLYKRIYEDGKKGAKRTFTLPADRSGCGNNSYSALTPLLWSWFVERYTGVAHGSAGVLMTMMDVPNKIDGKVKNDVTGALDYLLSLKTHNGNFCVRVDETMGTSPQLYAANELVQLCHGASGIAICLCRAYEILGDEKYLNEAKEAAETVWNRGLLKKGVGMCHGLAGNAAVFAYLYRLTKDTMYRQRAETFLQAAMEWETTYAPQRENGTEKTRMVSTEEELGLFEGWGGMARVVVDLVWEEKASGLVGVFVGGVEIWNEVKEEGTGGAEEEVTQTVGSEAEGQKVKQEVMKAEPEGTDGVGKTANGNVASEPTSSVKRKREDDVTGEDPERNVKPKSEGEAGVNGS
ncbi:Glutathione S-transferase lancl1 [Rhizophlyctis rosea]|nr:Glutathione S-transferase lancl1 [Rhizophlyctis rosea]